MNRIDLNLAQELFDQTPHNWNNFVQQLQQPDGRMSNLDPAMRQKLIQFGEQREKQGAGFPGSAMDLYQLLADHLGATTSY